MSDDEAVVERRSMVGAPPSSNRRIGGNSAVTPRPIRTPSARISTKSAKRRREEESGDESGGEKNENDSDGGDNDPDDSGDDGEDMSEAAGKPKKAKRRRGYKPLTDSIARKKRTEARKAAEREARLQSGYESPVEVKPPTPEPEEEPEPIARPPAVNKYSPLQLMCDHLLRKVQNKDPDEYFAFPVTPSMAPDYHNIITNPMDFSSMRQKVEDDAYTSIPLMRLDVELIVSNALSYNNPNTVYHLAATRLSGISRYYFSEQYLRYIFHTLPFANSVPLEKAGLKPLSYVPTRVDNKRRLAVVDTMTGADCLKAADPSVRDRLSTRTPAKIAFLDNRDGATVLNVLGDVEKKNIRLIDVVGPLEEGNPGMLTPTDHRLSAVSSINYLNQYGPYCSFAPVFDTTWASLTQRDSDLLLRTYGDRPTSTEAMSMRNMVSGAGEHFIKIVDDMLDSATNNEHSRAMQALKLKKIEKSENIIDLLDDIESLENLGVDVSFVSDIRDKYGVMKSDGIQAHLNATGRAAMDLARIQQDRLAKPPPVTLTKVPQPSALESQLANTLQQNLASQVAAHALPMNVVSPVELRSQLGIMEQDIMQEFFC